MELKEGYKQTEVGVIPKDWTVTTAANVCELVVDCKNRTPPVVNGGDYAVVRTPNVRNGKFVREELRFTDQRSFQEWTARATPQIGDILITREAPLGEVCLVPLDVRVCLGQRMMLYRPTRSLIESSFLLYALMSSGVQSNLLKKIGGSTVGHAKVDDIRYLQIPLPPTIAEQKAIADALSDADALIESLDQLITKKRQIKQGAIQELLTGKRRLPGFGEEWELKILCDLAEVHKGSGLSKSLISSSGLNKCILYGELFTTYDRVIRSVGSRTDSLDGRIGIRGDILLPGSTTTSGVDLAVASALLDDDVVLGGDINVVRKKNLKSFHSIFMAYMLTHTQKKAIADMAQGSTIIHLYGRDLLRLTVTLPSTDEQAAIATVLDEMDTELAALESRLAKARQIKQGMMQELLTGRIRLL